MSAQSRVRKLESETGTHDDGWCHCPQPMEPRQMNYRDGMEGLAPDFDLAGVIKIPRCTVCGRQNGLPVVPIGFTGTFE